MRDDHPVPPDANGRPDWHRAVQNHLASFALDAAQERDIADELTQHLDDRYDELIASGLSEQVVRETLRDELAEIANVSRDAWRTSALSATHPPIGAPIEAPIGVVNDGSARGRFSALAVESLVQDVRYAWRGLTRAPLFALVAILSLTLGIGATTAAFSMLHTLLLEWLPLPHPEQLALIRAFDPLAQDAPRPARVDGVASLNSFSTYDALRRTASGPRVEGFDSRPMTVTAVSANAAPNYDVLVDMVTGGWFDLLGVRPMRGRGLTRDDEHDAAPVAVISAAYWSSRFAADTGILGRRIDVGGAKLTVVGVMPPTFRGLYFDRPFTVAVPVTLSARLIGADVHSLAGLLLVTRVTAAQPAGATKSRIESTLAGLGIGQNLVLENIGRGMARSTLRRDYATFTYVLFGGVGILLLIACANVGTMLLGRAMAREREIAIRLSFGASATRIARQLFIESFQLAAIGTIAGVALARAATVFIARRVPSNADVLAELLPLRPSAALIAAVAGVMIIATVLTGMLPALLATRADLRTSLSGRVQRILPRWRADHALVAAQIALGLVLVTAASLFVATLRTLTEQQGGYRTTNIVLGDINFQQTPYRDVEPATLETILASIRRQPGVTSAGFGSSAPLVGFWRSAQGMQLVGAPQDANPKTLRGHDVVAATPGYLSAAGMGIIAGRDFDAADRFENHRVVILSAAYARRYGAPASLIGQTMKSDTVSFTVVGVAGDARVPQFGGDKRADIRGESVDCVYVPFAQVRRVAERVARPVFVVRVDRHPGDVASAVRRSINESAPGIRIGQVRTVTQVLDDALPRERLAAAVSLILGLLAMILAAIGVSGVVGYYVVQRTTEIGVRLALGARPVDAWLLVLRHVFAVTSVGVAVGVALALAVGRMIGAQLYGISPTDMRVLAGAATLFLAVAAGAALLPAFRAARVDPMIALRAA